MDKEEGIFEISGRSLPEDADSFYNDIINWIEKYTEDPNDETLFVFKLDYYNSSTARKISDIFILLERINSRGNKIKVKWYYQEDDDVMKENGEDFQLLIKIPFEFEVY